MPGQGSISGTGLGMLFAGGILLWSGLHGKKATSVLRNVIAGKDPNSAASSASLATTADTATAGNDAIPTRLSGSGPGIGTPAAANEAIVKSVAVPYGWAVGSEWNALVNLIMSESGFRNTAQNPTSTAYGMFQFLDTTWAGVGGVKTSVALLQAIYGLKYIKQRYGTPSKAWAFHQANNWY